MKIYRLWKGSVQLARLKNSRVANMVRIAKCDNDTVFVCANIRNYMQISKQMFPSLYRKGITVFGKNRCVKIVK